MANPRDADVKPERQHPVPSPPDQDGGSGTRNETRIPRVGSKGEEEE